jgi:tagaturonate epimerase
MPTQDMMLRAVMHGGIRWVQGEGTLPACVRGESAANGWLCRFNGANAAALRAAFDWLRPTPVGLRKSIGCGDRLGLATPGHLEAVRQGDMFPVLAQQSIREMQRAGRTAQQVMDDVTWGVLVADYRQGWGCDADHLKTTEAIDDCIAAGFIGFTLDPGEYVDNTAQTADAATLKARFDALPWEQLECSAEDFITRYLQADVVTMTEETLWRAACKYLRAVAHVVTLSRHIAMRLGSGVRYDLEVSVDETEMPTSPAEHFLIASELIRLGIPFTGLAPRFVGDFEKGVDYIGDLATFEADYAAHARIQKHFDRYKLSIHSGSDKFSIYPIIAKHSNPRVHLKTAGTSWLEALRVIAQHEPSLFVAMLTHACEHYPQDKASYHVSAQLDRIPPGRAADDLPALLDHFDARQVLHVTFGSLLAAYRDDLYAALRYRSDAYRAVLRTHFARHITPFGGA